MRTNIFYIIIPILIFISQPAIGQEIAVTERGDSIVLYSNGSWEYYENYLSEDEGITDIKINSKQFLKPNSSTKKINGSNQAYEVWYDSKKWKRIPVGEINPDADIALQLIKGDAYAMVIYEELGIPVENLSQIALDNAINAASDFKLIDREYRVVENDTLIWMRMDGTIQGIKISYYSYYYSNEDGSIQFHTFTGQKLLEKYKGDLENLLNGLTIKKSSTKDSDSVQ